MAMYGGHWTPSLSDRRTAFAGDARDLERLANEALGQLRLGTKDALAGLQLSACGNGHLGVVSLEAVSTLAVMDDFYFGANVTPALPPLSDAAVVCFQADSRRDVEAQRVAAIARIPAGAIVVSTDIAGSSKDARIFGAILYTEQS
ncbi:MAG: hypothetical protein WC803_13545 [Sphingomonas sp.]|jgi:hypothetical protein